MLRLIGKWLKAGVIENGIWSQSVEGTPQGASASPLLANVYLHYVLDLWADRWRRQHAHGDVIIVRFADDYIVGFEHERDAQQFLVDLRDRLATFCLELAAEKTRLIEFGRYAARRRHARGLGRPETFAFLGFTHGTCARRTRTGVSCSSASRSRSGCRPSCVRSRKNCGDAGICDPRARQVACKRGARAPRLLRRARRHRCGRSVPRSGNLALVPVATAPQPAHTPELGAHDPHRQPIATARSPNASLAPHALRRPHPREEPSALAAHAGICAGGRRRRRSLPRSTGRPGSSTRRPASGGRSARSTRGRPGGHCAW